MKPIKFLSLCAGPMLLAIVAGAAINHKTEPVKSADQTINGKGFALLELFTSEGCSSCPSADELLAKIQKESQGKPVYVLAYHVDYWNQLGWKDIFSNADYSKRQKEYSYTLNAQVYTPQVVINGKSEAVGSDERALRNAIAEGLAGSPSANITLQAQQNGDKLTVNYQVTSGSATDKLLLAVVQKSAVSKVKAGENDGRTLTHAQIVRGLYPVKLTPEKKGVSTIKLPQGFNTQGWEVVGFVQSKTNGEILSATKAQFSATSTAAL
ncbi:DUF1223 domain-containing protein [Mucilaginibacter sabulilitoris]|uniref:DUF1223 domain-containing protein n=1 Tax=Mucilaginibacter sabulilitoris TaxID=1173583 RepID=A0ABZ0TQD9_9SPHI|nr:DUF1223 domain-containing protein [Mucilaginibacter sabulilitoris]WPU95041.1 DUF1223 domain-containing protein [Mucilaginibacter sabulilitoris]